MNTDPATLGLDPLFFTPLKLHVRTVNQLRPLTSHKNLYLLNGRRPVRFAELCGVIVAVEHRYNMITYTIDDATDTIQCCLWRSNNIQNVPFAIGTTVCVCGRISDFRDTRQITIRTLQKIDMNREVMHDVLAIHLMETVYSKEFRLPEDVIENLESIKAEMSRQTNEEDWFWEPNESTLEGPEEDNALKDEIYFAKEMLAFLRSTAPNQAFSKTMPHSSKKLRDVASVIVRSYRRTEPDNRSINLLFKDAIEILCKDGEIVEVEGGGGLFVLLHNHDLEKRILDIIREARAILTGNFAHGGIMLDYIIAKIMEEKIYVRLPRDRIISCIDAMVTKGLLYLTRNREYKICEP